MRNLIIYIPRYARRVFVKRDLIMWDEPDGT